MKKKLIITYLVALVISLIGIAYAYFNYYKDINAGDIVSGDIYLEFEEGINSLTFTNALPETAEEARSRNNNTLTFTVKGKNTSNYDILYSIELNNGNSQNNKERFDPDDIVFDLVEINGNTRTMLLNAVSYNEFNRTKIWDEVVRKNTNEQISHTYELRMWIDENVTYGEGDNVDYTIDEFINSYASIKVAVEGDVTKKEYIKLEFDGNGGETERLYKYVVIGEDYGELPNVKVREGYTFLGWNGKNLFNPQDFYDLFSNFGVNIDENDIILSNVPYQETKTKMPVFASKNTQYNLKYNWEIIELYNEAPYISTGLGLFYDDGTRLGSLGVTSVYGTEVGQKGEVLLVSSQNKTIEYILSVGWAYSGKVKLSNIQLEEGNVATSYERYFVTSDTEVTEWNTNMVLKARWQENS